MTRNPLFKPLLAGILFLAVSVFLVLPAYAAEHGWLAESTSIIEELWEVATGWWSGELFEGSPGPDLGPTMDPNG